MTVEESNKMIAEFMGYGYHPNDTLNGIKGVLRKEGKLSLHAHLIDKSYCPEYHTSWDWLHPVVDKIHNELSLPEYSKYLEMFMNLTIFSSIDQVYSAVTQFLTYINEKK